MGIEHASVIILAGLAILVIIGLAIAYLLYRQLNSPRLDEARLANEIAQATAEAIERLATKIVGTLDLASIAEIIDQLDRGDGVDVASLKQLPVIHRTAAAAYLSERLSAAHAAVSKDLATRLAKGYAPDGTSVTSARERLDYITKAMEELVEAASESNIISLR